MVIWVCWFDYGGCCCFYVIVLFRYVCLLCYVSLLRVTYVCMYGGYFVLVVPDYGWFMLVFASAC